MPRTHELRGELQRAREIEIALGRELDHISALLDSKRPSPTQLDPETTAARATHKPLAPPQAPTRPAAAEHETNTIKI